MRKAIIAALVAVAWLAATLSMAFAAPATPEDRYVAARDAAIEKISAVYDAGKFDDAAKAAEEAARADLLVKMKAIVNEPRREGFGPASINIDTFYKGDEGFGTLDGLRFDAELGASGEKAGGNGADGKYVEPRSHIIVTTQSLFGRWLRDHKEWWGREPRDVKNVPQRIADALRTESFYTQAISSGSAVIDFNSLPVAKPASATFAYAMLAGRTQSEVPDAADEVFVSALAGGKAYVVWGSIRPEVKIPACMAIRDGFNKRSTEAFEKFQRKEISQKTYDKMGNLRQQGEDAFKRCFTERAPKQPAFAEATKQAQALLATAMGK
jgi:hypothetical protein